jgi:hypothetical protein
MAVVLAIFVGERDLLELGSDGLGTLGVAHRDRKFGPSGQRTGSVDRFVPGERQYSEPMRERLGLWHVASESGTHGTRKPVRSVTGSGRDLVSGPRHPWACTANAPFRFLRETWASPA